MHARGSPPDRVPCARVPGAGPGTRGYRAIPAIAPRNTSRETDLLVRFGIDSMAGRMVARILVALILLQPVYVAYGMELEEVASEEIAVSSIPGDAEVAADTESNMDLTHNDTNLTQNVADGNEVPVEVGEETMGETEVPDVEDESTDITTSADERSTTEETASSTHDIETGTNATSSEATEEEHTAEGDVTGETNTSTATSSVATTTATTSAQATGTVDPDAGTDNAVEGEDATSTELQTLDTATSSIENEANKYSFGDGECTLVAEGEFYCVASGPVRQVDGDPRVYAEKDREGDREIYYFDGVTVTRITNNGYDDFAPVFEEEQGRIVWQAMINDRLQIMVHDLVSHETRQITTSRQNSSNPNIRGDIVVWQEWIDTNWEIMMTDVDNDGAAFDIEQLTDNVVHDMFPQVYDGLITWQREKGRSWEVIVYDMRTGKEQALQKDEDTKYENPRFVLLFDSRHENGDVETVGYDLESGEMMELGTRARPIPADPKTPDDETPKAIARTGTSTPELKEAPEGDGGA